MHLPSMLKRRAPPLTNLCPDGRLLRRFGHDRGGAFLIAFAVALPILLGSVSAAIEYSRLLYRKAQLQSAVDAGVLAGANMLK
ncbi:TadE/TadG family type IV pilus assembly protein, partial [Methylobacterium nonmethylotrophicum]